MQSIIEFRKTKLTQPWLSWLNENIDRGCNQQELINILNQHNFNFSNHLKLNLKSLIINNLNIISDPNKLEIYTFDNFLSRLDCQTIIDIMQTNLTKSKLAAPDPDQEFRTSQTSYLSFLNNNFIKTIDQKIADTMGIDIKYSEGIQAQLYHVNQQFKPHTDYFTPGSPAYQQHCENQNLGNRTWTFMVYLNEVEAGGETYFPQINQTFTPKLGQAVIWNNLQHDGNGNYNALHAGLPVKSGYKAIITKWFRQKINNYL